MRNGQRGKCVVAMSGGVDSSVAALLLQQQGYEVLGVTMQLLNWKLPSAHGLKSCYSSQTVQDAARVTKTLGIRHEVIDVSDEFFTHVVAPFINEWRAGRTPNPCILCNWHIKFSALRRHAAAKGADFIATGHHARIEVRGNSIALLKGRDPDKDQSYFLFPLTSDTLSCTLFPIGGMVKQEVRAIGAKAGLPTAHKQESYDICFAPEGNYVEFLKLYGGFEESPGPIVLEDGREVGRHRGLHHFTIGQRKGLGVGWRHPLYVVEKRLADNTLVVGPERALGCSGLDAAGAVWLAALPPKSGDEVTVKVRYRGQDAQAVVESATHDRFRLRFPKPVYAVTPGQAAVLYQGDRIIGGGWIIAALRTGEVAQNG